MTEHEIVVMISSVIGTHLGWWMYGRWSKRGARVAPLLTTFDLSREDQALLEGLLVGDAALPVQN